MTMKLGGSLVAVMFVGLNASDLELWSLLDAKSQGPEVEWVIHNEGQEWDIYEEGAPDKETGEATWATKSGGTVPVASLVKICDEDFHQRKWEGARKQNLLGKNLATVRILPVKIRFKPPDEDDWTEALVHGGKRVSRNFEESD